MGIDYDMLIQTAKAECDKAIADAHRAYKARLEALKWAREIEAAKTPSAARTLPPGESGEPAEGGKLRLVMEVVRSMKGEFTVADLKRSSVIADMNENTLGACIRRLNLNNTIKPVEGTGKRNRRYLLVV